ncbi:hypothetical protein [Pengzhenrongella sicca]|uniref:Uncharacterized protein n=1 Tax=Pengzhenrongella sicca TaxID=2819238 RepID=A0A8A4ZIK7_9MICO|nr:hypothetical protein [Pengzhenrongella sicca]QTE30346.1 hypothetical protein J4E96_04935 [Pengzhenrongella sicca]
MSTVSRGPSDQVDDELLVLADLPAGWDLLSRSAGKRPEDASVELDAVLGYVDQTLTDEEPQAQRDPDRNGTAGGRWRYIRHTETKTRVYLRLQRQGAIAGEVRITGVVYLPGRPGDPITSHLLRELPTARIEAAINRRFFAATRTNPITGGEVELPSGRKVAERDLLKPLAPKGTLDFYELVALQHSRLTANGDVNPSATMAELSGVALSTAQGWVAKARTRGLLPPGRRGRAG